MCFIFISMPILMKINLFIDSIISDILIYFIFISKSSNTLFTLAFFYVFMHFLIFLLICVMFIHFIDIIISDILMFIIFISIFTTLTETKSINITFDIIYIIYSIVFTIKTIKVLLYVTILKTI